MDRYIQEFFQAINDERSKFPVVLLDGNQDNAGTKALMRQVAQTQ